MHFTWPDRNQAKHKWAEHHSSEQGYLYRDILGCFYRHAANRSKEVLVLFTQHLLHHVWKTTLHSGAHTMRKKLTNCSECSWGQSSWRGGGSTCSVRKGWGNWIQSEGLKGNPRVFFQYLRLSRKCSNTLYLGAQQQDERLQSHEDILIWGEKEVTVTRIKHWHGCPENCALSILGGFQGPAEQSRKQLDQKAEETEDVCRDLLSPPSLKNTILFLLLSWLFKCAAEHTRPQENEGPLSMLQKLLKNHILNTSYKNRNTQLK